MRKQTAEDKRCALRRRQRDFAVLVKGGAVQGFVVGFVPVRGAAEGGAQAARAVTARNAPKAAVFNRGVLQRDPEAKAALGLCAQIGGVLVAHHFAADVRLLEYIHGLQRQGLLLAEAGADLPEGVLPREGVKGVVKVMHGMAHLVERKRQRLGEVAIFVERFFLKEKPCLMAGFEEIAVLCVGFGFA